MTDDSDRRPVRWGPLALGLVLGAGSLWGGIVLGIQVCGGPLRLRFATGLFVLLVFGALGGTLLYGVRLVAHGVGGERRPSLATYRAAWFALLAAGLVGTFLLVLFLSESRPWGPDWWGLVIVVSGVTVSFLLARIMRRLSLGQSGPGLCRGSRGLFLTSVPLFLVLALLFMVVRPSTTGSGPHRRSECVNNARNMAIIFSERARKRDWPPYGGKNFVLSLVAHKLIDIRNPDNLEIFFCPGSGDEQARPTREAYELVTKEALTRRRFPELTDFAGRRNDEAAYVMSDAEISAVGPILACVLGDIVVVGFSDGAVRRMDRDDLGLGSDEEIVFGEASVSPLLRKLSDR